MSKNAKLIEGRTYYLRDGRVARLVRPSTVTPGGWEVKLEDGGRVVTVRERDLKAEAGPKALRDMFRF